MFYVFTCKTDPMRHKPHYRPQEKTAEGTKNLGAGVVSCNSRRGIAPTTETTSAGTTSYSAAGHRALIALRCAKSHRPFNSVLDEDYQTEVEMLRPGTVIPHPITVSHDICVIYLEMSKHVRDYFAVCFCFGTMAYTHLDIV